MKRFFFPLALLITIFCNAQTNNFEQGLKAYNEKDYEKALICLDHEINDNPKSGIALFYRAATYYFQDNKSYALKDMNNAIENISPTEKERLAGAYMFRGRIYKDFENYNKTFEDYSSAVRISPNDPDIYISRAKIYFELEQYSKAESDYKQALKIDESLVEAYAGLGENYIFQKKYKEAGKVLNKCVKLSPESPEGYYFRALAYYEQKKYDKAIKEIFKTVLLDVEDTFLRDLFVKYSEKNYALSLSKVNTQITSQSENAKWYYIRAQLLENKNNFKEAINDYSKLLKLYNNDIAIKAEILEDRASCYSSAGMYEQSVEDYSQAISIDSTDAFNFSLRGDVKRLMGDFSGAKEDFTKAIKILPNEAWFYYQRGWIEEAFLKDYEAGLNDYTDAISINNGFTYAYLMRGRLYGSKLNNPIKAKEDINHILTIETSIDDQGNNCRQYALFHLEHNEEAMALMNKILEKYPTAGNYYDATCLYSLMNKPKDALKMLKLALKDGYRNFNGLATDDYLENILNLPEFKNLIAEWKNICDE